MDMPLAARESVLEAYGQGPSNYVLKYVGECVGDRWGSEEARRFNNGLIELTQRFKSLKATGVPLCDDANIEAVSTNAVANHGILAPYFLSALAFQCFRRGDGQLALHLLQVAKECDERFIRDYGIEALYPHLLQSDHNICRMLVSEGRETAATDAVREMIISLLRLHRTSEPRLAVSLELMGVQLVGYLVSLVQKGRIQDDCATWDLADLPPSHTLANIQLWRAIRACDTWGVAEKLANRRLLYFSILKIPALEFLSRRIGREHDA
ncbi:hypothetical protein [Rhizobium leguminosarum]|uniref:hypothetical protein n=1 Tax=Rhizobium leguminosarum TaxID=384 RepID=UPI000489E689|nr:hypothetical protein [Rhizobium leguminosarum]